MSYGSEEEPTLTNKTNIELVTLFVCIFFVGRKRCNSYNNRQKLFTIIRSVWHGVKIKKQTDLKPM